MQDGTNPSEFFEAHDSEIRSIADRLKDFRIEGRKIHFVEAKGRVENWLRKFSDLGITDLTLPLRLLENIDFFRSDDISDRLYKLSSEFLCHENSFIAPLGETSESSFRISSNFNQHRGFYGSLSDLLDKIPLSFGNKILLFDDFLNSGGQLCSIIYAWLNLEPSSNFINDEIDKRTGLSEQQIEKLRTAEIHFFYYYIFFEGYEKIAEEVNQKFGLNIKIHFYRITNKNEGVFGDETHQEYIKNSTTGRLHAYGPFNGFEFAKLTEFYDLIKSVGKQLLQKNEPHWSDHKYDDRALGYGNIARIIVTEYNIPTITLTCFWQTGDVAFQGKTTTWEALLPRRKKAIRAKVTVEASTELQISKRPKWFQEITATIKELRYKFISFPSEEDFVNNKIYLDPIVAGSIIDLFQNDRGPALILGRWGSGKTVFSLGFGLKLEKEYRYRVYYLNLRDHCGKDTRKIWKIKTHSLEKTADTNTVFIIDDVHYFPEQVFLMMKWCLQKKVKAIFVSRPISSKVIERSHYFPRLFNFRTPKLEIEETPTSIDSENFEVEGEVEHYQNGFWFENISDIMESMIRTKCENVNLDCDFTTEELRNFATQTGHNLSLISFHLNHINPNTRNVFDIKFEHIYEALERKYKFNKYPEIFLVAALNCLDCKGEINKIFNNEARLTAFEAEYLDENGDCYGLVLRRSRFLFGIHASEAKLICDTNSQSMKY